MQHNDERPPTSGRPSLLSPEQMPEAGGPRILGGLAGDGPSEGISAGSASRSRYSLLAAGVLAIAVIGGGAALWLDGEGDKQIVLASTEPLAAAQAKAAAPATEPAIAPAPTAAEILPVNPEADQVSTAAILQESPPLAESKSNAGDELTTLLEHRNASEAKPASPLALVVDKPAATTPVLAKPAPKPVVKKLVVAKAAAAKPAVKPAQKASAPHALAAAPARKKNDVHSKATQSMDSDVTLLAALVAHSKAIEPKKTSRAAEKLRQCKALASVAEAEQCRARICAAGTNEADCKPARLAKAATES